ncbi:hypothetical protein BDY21DRAFT_4611 [Lineolata rhizophorae]|uniref:G-protein coupled receptors family 3 profile domain-containing protein n=1 Tax=Lineolata rhizophorae TaxID=578093 RepID=A0A6A6PDC5_9PEZI|nr:hypothetical protein BDY21DRAFT_4611 [Lineolata rhizophorae]
MARVARALEGLDWRDNSNLDPLGIFYIVVAILHSLAVITGLVLLYKNRDTPAVRIRNFNIVAPAIVCLHIYSTLVLLVYPQNGFFKCGTEFWVMSVFLPVGYGLFQASNARLLSYSAAQQHFSQVYSVKAMSGLSRVRNSRFFLADLLRKTYVGVLLGLIVQMLSTIVLFFGSFRFHRSYGFFGDHVNAAECRRGPEWIPSVLWQAFWTWGFGPYLMYKIRHLRDTRYWAWQTRLAIIAGLPATPLWLAFLYGNSGAVGRLNLWFPPPAWFLPSVLTIEAISIIFPLLDNHRSRQFERKLRKLSEDTESISGRSSTSSRERYSMSALESQVASRIEPLLDFAASREFTAENILFLREVRDYRRRWDTPLHRACALTPRESMERYQDAAVVFFTLVNPITALFNINIKASTLTAMAAMFKDLRYDEQEFGALTPGGAPAPASPGVVSTAAPERRDVACPWEDDRPQQQQQQQQQPVQLSRQPSSATMQPQAQAQAQAAGSADELTLLDRTRTTSMSDARAGRRRFLHTRDGRPMAVPDAFSPRVFDAAYDEIKVLVFTNTWGRYVRRSYLSHAGRRVFFCLPSLGEIATFVLTRWGWFAGSSTASTPKVWLARTTDTRPR